MPETGWLAERADTWLGWLGRVGQRRRAQTLVCLGLVSFAVISGRWSHSELALPGVLLVALLGSAPLLSLRRFPVTSLVLMLVSNSLFILFDRLAWPMANVLAWLIALVACPIVLSRRPAVAALLATELVVLAAAWLVRPGSARHRGTRAWPRHWPRCWPGRSATTCASGTGWRPRRRRRRLRCRCCGRPTRPRGAGSGLPASCTMWSRTTYR